MQKLNLPKGRLSWSQFNSWRRNKDAYRREYYFGVKREPSPEMRYGDTFARMLEHGARGAVLDKVPQLPVSEHEILVEIQGVPVLGFIDSFNPKNCEFLEYKTGHKNAQGKVPWDKVKVAKHEQLPFYAALITEKHGKCKQKTALVWIETEVIPIVEDFGGIEMKSTSTGSLKLTGHVEIFPRTIQKWEVKRMADMIREVADEISVDFTMHQKELFNL